MADLAPQFKALRLYGMAQAFAELQQNSAPAWSEQTEAILRPLLQAEMTDRGLRSIRYQMNAARFPVHRDLAGFVFEHSPLDRRQIEAFATLAFTEKAENLVFLGGTGTGKTHLATALGVQAITRHGKRVRFFSTLELVNALEQEKIHGKAGSWRTSSCTWTSSSSTNWATCRSRRPAAPCCSTCSASSTSTPA
jgi:DNA replication protein DnaC